MDAVFDRYIDRRGTNSSKWMLFEAPSMERLYGDDYIYLSTADMDFQCSEAIQASAKKVVDRNLYGYTMLTHETGGEYFDAVREWMQKTRGWELKRENIFYVPGSINGIRTALQAVTKPGDGVIINRPVYGPFTIAIEGQSRKVVNNELLKDENGYYTLDYEGLDKLASDPNTTAYLLCSPHNPVGRVWTEEELRKIMKFVKNMM